MCSKNLSAEIVCPQTLPSAHKHYLLSPQTLLKTSRKHYLYSLPQTLHSTSAQSCRSKFWSAEPDWVSIPGNHGRCSDWVRLCWPRDGQLRSYIYTKSMLETLAFEWCKFYRSLCTMWLATSNLTGTAVNQIRWQVPDLYIISNLVIESYI